MKSTIPIENKTEKPPWKKKQLHISEGFIPLESKIPKGLGSQLYELFVRASKLNTDAKDRELANRELDIFIEKITS